MGFSQNTRLTQHLDDRRRKRGQQAAALDAAEVIVIAPSNPIVSVGPILAALRQLGFPGRAVARVLARQGCLAVLRATYDDATQSLAVTVGVAVLVGVGPEPIQVLPSVLFNVMGYSLLGSLGYRRDDVVRLVRLVAAGRLDLSGSISARLPLAAINDGVRRLEDLQRAVDILPVELEAHALDDAVHVSGIGDGHGGLGHGLVTPPARIVPVLDAAGGEGLEAEGLSQKLVGAQARLEVVRDGHDHQLGGPVRAAKIQEPVAHLLGRARDGAPSRVVDNRQLLLGVRVRFGFLDRWECPGPSRIEARDPEIAALRDPLRFRLGVGGQGEDGDGCPRRPGGSG